MVDVMYFKDKLKSLLAELDPDTYDVAVEHLRDALAAVEAVEQGQGTKFTLHDRLVRGEVTAKPVRRKVR